MDEGFRRRFERSLVGICGSSPPVSPRVLNCFLSFLLVHFIILLLSIIIIIRIDQQYKLEMNIYTYGLETLDHHFQ